MIRAGPGQVLIVDDKDADSTDWGFRLMTGGDPTRDLRFGTVRSVSPEHMDHRGKTRKTDPEIREGRRALYASRTVLKNGKVYNPNAFEEGGVRYVAVPITDVLALEE